MTTVHFASLRELVLYHAARRGWRTQRQIAVLCGIDESALSRLLNGEQDIGAWRTHALFRTVGIPVEQYDLAYALLGRAREAAAQREQGTQRERVPYEPFLEQARRRGGQFSAQLAHQPGAGTPPTLEPQPWEGDLPVALVLAQFTAQRLTGPQIAAFFEDNEPAPLAAR
ncbi:MAG TPA: helix-turn-helix transcriptional regulator [Dehalococcoidia bacterium]|jgi:transcriptional regulator with XRE-family HTH domain